MIKSEKTLYIWGPAFGLPSIDAECIATVAYCHLTLGAHESVAWSVVPGHDPAVLSCGMCGP